MRGLKPSALAILAIRVAEFLFEHAPFRANTHHLHGNQNEESPKPLRLSYEYDHRSDEDAAKHVNGILNLRIQPMRDQPFGLCADRKRLPELQSRQRP